MLVPISPDGNTNLSEAWREARCYINLSDKIYRIKNSTNRFVMKCCLAIVSLAIGFNNLAATAQSPTGTFKGTVIYPSDMLPAQKVCAQNVRTKRASCTETKQGQEDFSLSVVPGTYEIYAMECNKTYRQAIACRDGYRSRRAYYNLYVRCGIAVECAKKFPNPQPLKVKIAAGQTIGKIQPHDWYSRPAK